MDFDELLCTICLSQFDKDEHLPLMVPKCGHTFCSKCLVEIISNLPSENNDFICPEDQTPMKLQNRDISEFPQNFTLLRLLDKRAALSEKQSSSFSREERSTRKENKDSSDKSPCSTRDLSSPLGSPGCLTKDGYSLRNSFSQQDMFNLMQADMNMCREHNRKLEVVCLEHKCRICANCALFGVHKGHDIKPEEEVLREIAMRAERLIDIFQAMEKSQSAIVEQDAAEKVNERIKRKCEEVTKVVRQRVNEYVATIRTRERKILTEIGEKFSKMEESFKQLRQIPEDFAEKISKWKSRTHDSLLAVTEKSERGEISFDLLEDRSNQKNDLLLQGEKFILDLERVNEVNMRLLETNLSKVKLSFDSDFARSLETLCIVEVPDVNLSRENNAYYNTRDDSRISLPLKDAMNKSPQNMRKDSLLDAEKQDQTSMSRSPNKQTASKYSIENDSFKLDATSGAVEKENEDDNNNLLSFEWKDLSSKNHVADTSSYTIKVNGHRKFSSGDMTNKSRDYKENSITGNRTPTNVRSQTQLTVPDEEYPTVKPSSGGKIARAASPSKKGGEQGVKAAKTKKKIKVTDKFEGVVEGIEQNMIETADLTGAELGDQGVLALIEHLKENTALKSLKLLKNKITDEGGIALANLFYYNNTIQTLNLTQNQLTERTLDAFIDVIKEQPSTRLKSIYFSQNTMSLRNVKSKLKELEKMGVNAVL